MNKHIVIGTAGHIDHGKSALIKALTGTDPDRLKEEKERGMTTDLGFAFYGDNVTIIDVPGHEKFVRHMLAGASTIDFVLLVIAADDGIMPQTTEHLDILKLLELKQGIIVLTKRDLVDAEHLEMVTEEIRDFVAGTFLEKVPIIPVSNTTGEGIDILKKTIDNLIPELETKIDRGVFRMPIDRCFTIKGFGTVVAGTILSGIARVGETYEILPSGKKVKIRGIEVHNQEVTEAGTGFRAAINLTGVEKEEVERGDVISQVNFYKPSSFINASLYVLQSAEKPLRNLVRLRIHFGTKEVLGRIVILEKKTLAPGEKGMVQFRLETPAVSDVGDRYVIRTYSPPMTIGGGVIIEPKAEKVRGFDEQLIEHLHKIEDRDPVVMVTENIMSNYLLPRKIDEIAYDLNLQVSQIRGIVQELLKNGQIFCIDDKRGLYYGAGNIAKMQARIQEILGEYHKSNPTLTGMPKIDLGIRIGRGLDNTLLGYVLDRMSTAKIAKILPDNKISLHDFGVVLDKGLDIMVKKLDKLFYASEYRPPDYNELIAQRHGSEDIVKKAYRYLIDSGLVIFLGEGIAMHRAMVDQARERLINFLKGKKEIRVAEFRDLLGGTSRKYALPLLIYFDTKGVTIKRGEVRVLGQR
jgi:selenocysteine-specific elongation factor